MKYFEQYRSNSYAGSGNQYFFTMQDGEIRTGRVFYKISVSGEYNYSLLFSNILDSTYADGSVGHKNLICDSWMIHGARIGKCKTIHTKPRMSDITLSDEGDCTEADITVCGLQEITFSGQKVKNVMPGEFFSSDPIKLHFHAGEYLCLEMTFSGRMIPYHEESLLPVFVKDNGAWRYCKQMPFAGMVGCDRRVKKRIAYLGDSITQGIGTPINSYLHWNAKLSALLGSDYAHWNLGIGYGRANDAASDGAWLFKAKQNDVVVVCYGVNDILKGQPEAQIRSDLTRIVEILKQAGKTVILQTVPPYDYTGEHMEMWERINIYIKTVLASKADAVFDNVPYLGKSDCPAAARFGGHPNAEGCEIWANALFEEIKHLF